MSDSRPRVGISACLLGEKVRYNGADKRDQVLLAVLGDRVEWVPVCPEVEVGMGTPREPVQLVKMVGGIRMLTVTTRIDFTEAMNAWAARRLDALAQLRLSGYVLKSRSPSCGLAVATFSERGDPLPLARGLFADALLRRFPDLPVEEEDALHDPQAIEAFLRCVRRFHQRAPQRTPR